MRKNFGTKAICYPMPVFIIGTYNADGTPNAMNAAWGGVSEENEITICVDSEHKTAENLLARKAFTVSMATANTLVACDYVGVVSSNKVVDKLPVRDSTPPNPPLWTPLSLTNCPWPWSAKCSPTTPTPAVWWDG